jgi:hypothetical protein
MLKQTLNGKLICYWYNPFDNNYMVVYEYQIFYDKNPPVID